MSNRVLDLDDIHCTDLKERVKDFLAGGEVRVELESGHSFKATLNKNGIVLVDEGSDSRDARA